MDCNVYKRNDEDYSIKFYNFDGGTTSIVIDLTKEMLEELRGKIADVLVIN